MFQYLNLYSSIIIPVPKIRDTGFFKTPPMILDWKFADQYFYACKNKQAEKQSYPHFCKEQLTKQNEVNK